MEQEKTLLSPALKQEEAEYAIVGISKDQEEVLIADYESTWVDETTLLHPQLITRYQDERSSIIQIRDWLKQTAPQLTETFEETAPDFSSEQLQIIDQELLKNNQALLLHAFELEDGTKEVIALWYNPEKDNQEELLHYLKHQVEALYLGRLIPIYQLSIQTVYETELSESLLEVTPSPIDRELLNGDERAILSLFQEVDFTLIRKALSEFEEEERADKQEGIERRV